MGNYNPHRPLVLGNEWVDIRNNPYALDTETERGHTFVLDTASTVVSGGLYIDSLPPNWNTKVISMAVYSTGTEDLTGPLQRVVIPPVSGVAFQTLGSCSTAPLISPTGVTIAQALATPNGVSYVLLRGCSTIYIQFDVNAYAAQLSGKRIHDVNILYMMASLDNLDFTNTFATFLLSTFSGSPGQSVQYSSPVLNIGSPIAASDIQNFSLGNTNVMFPPGGVIDVATSPSTMYPWRYQDLQRFALGATNGISFWMQQNANDQNPSSPFIYITYVALEVIYGEEMRLLYGGKGGPATGTGRADTLAPNAGQNIIQLRPSDTFAVTGKVLQPGEYTVTASQGSVGAFFDSLGGAYATRALRQLYPLPSHDGVEVTTRAKVGETYSQAATNILPQITLHTASAVVTGVHTYGTQVGGYVYAANNVSQAIIKRSGGPAVQFPQVRFYARRFGNTNVPLTFQRDSDATQTVFITPADFDLLDEIIDGWREVTLRFAGTIPTFDDAGTSSPWTFSAAALLASNQWQVLAARSIGATSGAMNTDAATYGGTTASMTGGGVTDLTADVVVIFSQDPTVVTGVAVAAGEQTLAVGADCTLTPHCTPTSLFYNRITWPYPFTLPAPLDSSFEVGVGGWTPTSGTFVQSGAFAHTGSFSGRLTPSGGVQSFVRFRVPITALTSYTVRGWVYSVAGYANVGPAIDWYNGGVYLSTSNLSGAAIAAGSWTPYTLTAAAPATATHAEFGPTVGGTPAVTDVLYLDDWLFGPAVTGFGYYELQRQDTVDTTWNTIMKTSSPLVTGFSDYEARVGVQSSYRIRTANALNFIGAWSATVSRTIPAPGITGAGDGNSVLIFTSNEHQNGSRNLAYVQVWDRIVSEDVTFPEGTNVNLQELYRRDFVTAFHGTERGGERLTRDILVQNAAVSTGRIRDGFTSLVDMAWDSQSYVCVRDELGDRWLAIVEVPSGSITRNRRLYIAKINIIEATATPSQVDPAA